MRRRPVDTRDSPKLNRDVAIKILPDAPAADPAALARFERQAQAFAALSHPNILAIHDFGRQGETAYAVMELLEGETLRARLVHGALPARKAVELAAQIAEGLAAVHEKGIVHRDLKPENVFSTGSPGLPRGTRSGSRARRLLDQLQRAHVVGDMAQPPGNRFERLSDRRYSVRVNDQYRVAFR